MIKVIIADLNGIYFKRVYFLGILLYELRYEKDGKKDGKKAIGY